MRSYNVEDPIKRCVTYLYYFFFKTHCRCTFGIKYNWTPICLYFFTILATIRNIDTLNLPEILVLKNISLGQYNERLVCVYFLLICLHFSLKSLFFFKFHSLSLPTSLLFSSIQLWCFSISLPLISFSSLIFPLNWAMSSLCFL